MGGIWATRTLNVARMCPSMIRNYTMPTFADTPPDKIAVIGSGSFGTAAAITIARNAAQYDFAETEVRMFVHDEDIDVGDGIVTFPRTAKLSRIMNDKKVRGRGAKAASVANCLVLLPSVTLYNTLTTSLVDSLLAGQYQVLTKY